MIPHICHNSYRIAAISAIFMIIYSPQDIMAQNPERPKMEDLKFAELEFIPPEATRYELKSGVNVFFLEDHSLPLVSIYARFKGGSRHFPRNELGAASAVPILLRSGGTADLSPDSVNKLLEFYAAETSFGGGGGTSFGSVNTLKRHLDDVLEIWGNLLKNPNFDSTSIEVWRGQELEDVRRKQDTPGRLAISKFNHLLFGDHPVGWELGEDDLEQSDLTKKILGKAHKKIYCIDNLILGVTGDVTWDEIEPRLERMLLGWPECNDPLKKPPPPSTVADYGVYIVPRDIEQSTIILGRTSEIKLDNHSDYFSSRIGNSVLGSSGLTSRLMTRIRTEEGLAYSAASVWTAPRSSQGIFGIMTQTKSKSTVSTILAILEVLQNMSTNPPDTNEVKNAIDRIVNGFVFNFQNPGQIVSRQMLYISQGLPLDWLTLYLDGIQDVTTEGIEDLFLKYLPAHEMDKMVILIVGNPDEFDPGLSELGTIRIIDPEENFSGKSYNPGELSKVDANMDGNDTTSKKLPMHISKTRISH